MHEWENAWMQNEWIRKWMGECKNEWLNAQMIEWMHKWISECTNEEVNA